MRSTLCLVAVLAITPGPAAPQEPAAEVVPAWEIGRHSYEIVAMADDNFMTHTVRFPIGGGRTGIGRFMSRAANAAGLGGFAMEVMARRRASPDEPGSDVRLSIWLKDLPEQMPKTLPITPLIFAAEAPGEDGPGASLSGPYDIPSGERMVEVTFQGPMRLDEFIRLVSRNRIDGTFDGRTFRIEGAELQALRALVLRVAAPGEIVDSRLLATPLQDRMTVAERHSAKEPLTDELLGAMMAERLPEPRGRLALNRSALGEVVLTALDPASTSQTFVVLQNVRKDEQATAVEQHDWRPMAAAGDTLWIVRGAGAPTGAVVQRRYRVKDQQGGCSPSIKTTGWVYEVDVAIGGDMPLNELGRYAVAGKPAAMRQVEAARAAEANIPSSVWDEAAKDARELNERSRLSRADMMDNATVRTLKGAGAEYRFVHVELSGGGNYSLPETRVYIVNSAGKIVDRMKVYLGGEPMIAVEGARGSEALVLSTGLVEFRDGRWRLPSILPFPLGMC
jgi:hypothetical protein